MFKIKVPPASFDNMTNIMVRSLEQTSFICLWRKYPLLRFRWMQSDNQYSRYSNTRFYGPEYQPVTITCTFQLPLKCW